MSSNQELEVRILVGIISDTEYIKLIRDKWRAEYIVTDTIRMLSTWCIEYYDKHKQAPKENGFDMVLIKNNKRLEKDEDLRNSIEEYVMPHLNSVFETGNIDCDILAEETEEYFKSRQIYLKVEQLVNNEDSLSTDDVLRIWREPINDYETSEGVVDLANVDDSLEKFKDALSENNEILIEYRGALGKFINNHLTRGGFVGFIAPEKAGKTWLMIDMMMKAMLQGRKVAFFQAGDMTEKQMLVRLGTYICKQPVKEQYSGERYVAIKDCIHNQLNDCDKKEREVDFERPIFYSGEIDISKEMPDKDKLMNAIVDANGYRNCFNCGAYQRNNWGTVFLEKKYFKLASSKKVLFKVKEFLEKHLTQIRISTHANNTLKPGMMRNTLNRWKEEGFVPDVIFVDYADLMIPDNVRLEFRHQQNDIWKSLRGINQEINCLLITASQADAKSYKKNSLDLENFSEDKRKYGHVTSMFSLNHDKHNIERDLRMMRIGNLLAREEEYSSNQVTIIQRLESGLPIYDSYFSYYKL